MLKLRRERIRVGINAYIDVHYIMIYEKKL